MFLLSTAEMFLLPEAGTGDMLLTGEMVEGETADDTEDAETEAEAEIDADEPQPEPEP